MNTKTKSTEPKPSPLVTLLNDASDQSNAEYARIELLRTFIGSNPSLENAAIALAQLSLDNAPFARLVMTAVKKPFVTGKMK